MVPLLSGLYGITFSLKFSGLLLLMKDCVCSRVKNSSPLPDETSLVLFPNLLPKAIQFSSATLLCQLKSASRISPCTELAPSCYPVPFFFLAIQSSTLPFPAVRVPPLLLEMFLPPPMSCVPVRMRFPRPRDPPPRRSSTSPGFFFSSLCQEFFPFFSQAKRFWG